MLHRLHFERTPFCLYLFDCFLQSQFFSSSKNLNRCHSIFLSIQSSPKGFKVRLVYNHLLQRRLVLCKRGLMLFLLLIFMCPNLSNLTHIKCFHSLLSSKSFANMIHPKSLPLCLNCHVKTLLELHKLNPLLLQLPTHFQ